MSAGNGWPLTMGWIRFWLSFWLGAAILFVASGVSEVTSPLLDSSAKDVLVARRFPLFYGFGLVSLGACVAAQLLVVTIGRTTWTMRLATGLTVSALAIFSYDYFVIFQPLLAEVVPPGKPRTQAFMRLHELTTQLNEAALALVAVARLLLIRQAIGANPPQIPLANTP